jgi:hypothetical protein
MHNHSPSNNQKNHSSDKCDEMKTMIVSAIQKSNETKIKSIIIVHQIIKKIIVQTNFNFAGESGILLIPAMVFFL